MNTSSRIEKHLDELKDVKLYKSKDYSKFKNLEYNRNIDKNHVERLKDKLSARNDLHLKPIIVTPDKQIIDGQHRFQAAKELGVEVYYLIDYDFEAEKLIIHNTSQKDWTCGDSFKHFLETGSHDYFLFKNLLDKYSPISMETMLFILKRGNQYGDIRKDFREGRFRFFIKPECQKTLDVWALIKHDFQNRGFKDLFVLKDKKFVEAIYRFFNAKHLEVNKFFNNLQRKPFVFGRHGTVLGFMEWMADIYNYNKPKDKVAIFSVGRKICVKIGNGND